MSFHLVTAKGYSLFEAVSAMIKCLRRGRTVEALYWALELESKYPAYLWRRLEVFAAEDIGYHNPQAFIYISALGQAHERHRKQSDSKNADGNLLSSAIAYLAGSPKNRSSDSLKNFGHWLHEVLHLEVPLFALDAHTARGKTLAAKNEPRELSWFRDASQCLMETSDDYLPALLAMQIADKPAFADEFREILAARFPDTADHHLARLERLVPHARAVLEPAGRSDEELERARDAFLAE